MGEAIIDDTVWIIKSHSPWKMKNQAWFANKSIVIVRNPLDSILSWLHFLSMNNHNQKCPFDFEKLYPNFFEWWAKDCAEKINGWMQFTMRDARLRRVPTLFLRFEDLVANPEPELRSIMSFLLGVKDLTGTNAERRIFEVLSMGKSATRVYDLKQSTLRFNSNVHRYTQE